MPPEKLHWKQLKAEVVDTGLCTGCAGCVVACPYDDVLGYDEKWKPFQLPHQPDFNSDCRVVAAATDREFKIDQPDLNYGFSNNVSLLRVA